MALDSLNREKIKVAVIMGSVRPGRFCDTVTSWLMSALEHTRDFALKVVDPAELHAVTLRDSVSFASAWHQFDERGELIDPVPAQKSLARMMAKMHWWASTLRSARRQRPYTPVAQDQVA